MESFWSGRKGGNGMALTYASGDEIQAGDRVLYHGEPGQIEFIARPGDWEFEQFGGGCMILAPSFGRVFEFRPEEAEDLEFVSRAQEPPR
jgi:hypothetical protein